MADERAPSGIVLRAFRAEDTERLVEVMTVTFAEYGMTFAPDGWDADVREVAARYAPPRAAFFAGIDASSGRALGFVGVDLPAPGTAELHRLYIDPAARGRGLGVRLCAAAEAWASSRGVRTMTLWSDVRFVHAHQLYAGRGYALMGQRLIGDPDRSVEFGFARELSGRSAEAWGGTPDVPEAPAGAPRPHSAQEARAVPVGDLQADEGGLGHRARMVAAALIDARALVRAGRVTAAAHELPGLDEVFRARPSREAPRPPATGVVATHALILGGDCVVGFAGRLPSGGAARALHPLFREA